MLEHYLMDRVKKETCLNCFLQHDNDSVSSAKGTNKCFKDNKIPTFDEPDNSPHHKPRKTFGVLASAISTKENIRLSTINQKKNLQ